MNILLQRPKTLPQWLRLYRIYRTAFPAAERKPVSIMLRMYRAGKSDIWYCTEDGRFLGLAVTINSPDLILLDYLAVAKACRGHGGGSALIQRLQRQYAGRGFFLEIESTLEPSPNPEQRQKRKAFYLRNGLKELGVTAELFGVNMELLGRDCALDFTGYHAFYRDYYNQWAADHVKPVSGNFRANI